MELLQTSGRYNKQQKVFKSLGILAKYWQLCHEMKKGYRVQTIPGVMFGKVYLKSLFLLCTSLIDGFVLEFWKVDAIFWGHAVLNVKGLRL